MSSLLKKTGEQFISIFAESEDDSDQELQSLYTISTKLIKDINFERSSAKQKEKSLIVQQEIARQSLSDQLSSLRAAHDYVNHTVLLLREEATMLEEQIRRAEQLRMELKRAIQNPEPQMQLPDDESIDYYKSEVLTGRQVQSNLKFVLQSDDLLIAEAHHSKDSVLEQLQLKESLLDSAIAEKAERNRKWTEEMREVQGQIEKLRENRLEADEKDLEDVMQSQKRTLESLRNEKNAVMLQIESRRIPALRRATLPSSRIGEMDFLQESPFLVKIATFFDERLLDIRTAMDDLAIVKLVVVTYLLVLHLWVLLSTLGIGTTC